MRRYTNGQHILMYRCWRKITGRRGQLHGIQVKDVIERVVPQHERVSDTCCLEAVLRYPRLDALPGKQDRAVRMIRELSGIELSSQRWGCAPNYEDARNFSKNSMEIKRPITLNIDVECQNGVLLDNSSCRRWTIN